MPSETTQPSSTATNAMPSSTFSFTAPFPIRGSVTSTKQRRVSLPSSPRFSPNPGWPFRDEMGLEAMSADKDIRLIKPDDQVLDPTKNEPMALLRLEKKQRKKWTKEETQMLVDGCNKWGVGNWKTILNDPTLRFDNRSPVDLKDRFRTYFPDAYKTHYPNAKTHLSSKVRSALPDGSSIFEKTRSKKRRPFTPEEDEALRRGYDKHGTLWASILKDPVFHAKNRRSTDLRDRFRNAFPDLYEAAGYKPRNNASKKKKGSEGLQIPVSGLGNDDIDVKETYDAREWKTANCHRRKRASTTPAPGVRTRSRRVQVQESVTCSDSDESSGGEDEARGRGNQITSGGLISSVGYNDITPQPQTGSIDVAPTEDPSPRKNNNSASIANDISATSELQRSFSLSEVTDSSQSQSHSHEQLQQSWSLLNPRWMNSSPASRVPSDIFLSRNAETQSQTAIGKSAWMPEDWLSANPRLESSHHSSSNSSFISVPSSPFSFSPSQGSSSHGVMDRYDLYSSQITSHHNYTSSEVGYGDGDRDTHSAFSEADMFNAGTSSFRGFTHHSNYAGDLIFAAGRTGSGGIYDRGTQASEDLMEVRRMIGLGPGLGGGAGLRSLPGIDEIPLGAIRLQDHDSDADADMQGAHSPPEPEVPPDLNFHIPPLLASASTPTSELSIPMSLPKTRHPSLSAFRSFSQPPSELPTRPQSHTLFDTPSDHDLTDLPFLDLHYYGAGSTLNVAHAALLQDPVVESLDLANQVIPSSHYHSIAKGQLQLSPLVSKASVVAPRPQHLHHQRVQSAVSPQDLLLRKPVGDNERKRVSWDGGAAA